MEELKTELDLLVRSYMPIAWTGESKGLTDKLLHLIKEREEKMIERIEALDQIPASQSRTEKNYLILKDDAISAIKEDHVIGEHGAVGYLTKEGRICAECGKPIVEE